MGVEIQTPQYQSSNSDWQRRDLIWVEKQPGESRVTKPYLYNKLIFAASWEKKSHPHTDCTSLKTRHKHVWPDAYAVIPAAVATRTQQQFCGLSVHTCFFMLHSRRYVSILVMSGEGVYVPVREYLRKLNQLPVFARVANLSKYSRQLHSSILHFYHFFIHSSCGISYKKKNKKTPIRSAAKTEIFTHKLCSILQLWQVNAACFLGIENFRI